MTLPGQQGAPDAPQQGAGAHWLSLISPDDAPVSFEVEIEHCEAHAPARVLIVRGLDARGLPRSVRYTLGSTGHADYLDMQAAVAKDFGLRPPLARTAQPDAAAGPKLEPLLTEPVDPRILYGYGDPSVLRTHEDDAFAWYLVVTSNDAPDAFPILRSDDLKGWRLSGFVFPEGRTPPWALTGANVADFWAPEMHRVGDAYWLCFAARGRDHELSIGLATAASPDGPFVTSAEPILSGGVIDPHILLGADGTPYLLWKADDNGVWPALMCEALYRRPGLVERLLDDPQDRRAACLALTLWPWIRTLEPMEQFFLLQPLIEAATRDFASLRGRLAEAGEDDLALQPLIQPILHAMRTRVFAQAVASDGSRLLGEAAMVLENDQPWEAHLIEGVWAVEQGGRYYLFYAANDFSTPLYGIGVAVADAPLGTYRKFDQPLLRSSCDWWGPGHPSVAPGPDGRLQMFLHAFFPGQAGYKAFRALLMVGIAFDEEHVWLCEP